MLFQLSMGILKLGVLSSLLSDSLMSGFTTGSAFHVLTSQVPHLLGYRIPKITGVGRLVKVRELTASYRGLSQINRLHAILTPEFAVSQKQYSDPRGAA